LKKANKRLQRASKGARLTDAPLKPESLAEGLKRACSGKADAALKMMMQERR